MLILNDSCHEIRGKQNSTVKVQINKYQGLPDGSDGKESASNAKDLSSIPGSGISPGKGNGYSPVFLVDLCTEKLISIV